MASIRDSGTVVWLVRHGQSTGNAGRATTDPDTIPLSPIGHRQATCVVDALDPRPDLIVSSPFLRARQTAQPTLDRLAATDLEVWPIQEFCYLGRLHGRSTTGAERRPLVDAYWTTADPSYRDDEKSESFVDVHTRARRFLARLTQHGATSVAAFTHGLFMRIVLWVLMTGETTPDAASMRRFHTFRTTFAIPNCSIIELSLHPHRGNRILGATTGHLPRALRTGE